MLWCAAKNVAIIHKENVDLITGFFFFTLEDYLGVEDEEAQNHKHFKLVPCLIKA